MPDLALLAELRVLALRRLAPMLQDVLGKTDDALFDLSQNATGAEQQIYFDAMRDLRRQRPMVEAAPLAEVERAFRALERWHAGAAAGGTDGDGLSLVDPDVLEEQLSCEQLAAAVEKRHADALQRLAAGLARLVDAQELETAMIPVAPLRLAQSYRDALTEATAAMPARLVSYKLLERVLLAGLGALIDELCRLLVARGVPLPTPVPAVRRAPPATTQRAAAAAVAGMAQAAQAGSPSGADAYGEDGSEAPDQLFLAMRDMFAAYFSGAQAAGSEHPRLGPGGRPVPLVPSSMALALLARMQRDPPPSLASVVDDRGVEFGELLQRELLRTAVLEGSVPPDARLGPHDEQAMLLVGMLFDVLLDQSRFQREARARFARLSVPYARIAMLDRRLFAHKSHPARRLLNALAEACDGNQGEAANERELLAQAFAVIDRLLAEFDQDPGLFGQLEAEFRNFTEQHHRRVALAEKRATEAQRGRERLDEARAAATLELASLVGDRPAPAPISAFLRRDWTHHLSIVALREGVDSDAFRKARLGGVKLWLAYLACEAGGEVPAELPDWLAPALQSTGQSSDAARIAIEEVMTALRALKRAPAPPAASAAPQASRQPVERPGFEIVSSIEAADEPAPVPEGDLRIEVTPGAARPVDLERIRSLAIGQWVEFVDADGVGQPAKLSWISPISSRLLFVNRRGMRLCAVLPEELAALMAEGKLALREVDTAFERAMSHMIGKLKASPPAPN